MPESEKSACSIPLSIINPTILSDTFNSSVISTLWCTKAPKTILVLHIHTLKGYTRGVELFKWEVESILAAICQTWCRASRQPLHCSAPAPAPQLRPNPTRFALWPACPSALQGLLEWLAKFYFLTWLLAYSSLSKHLFHSFFCIKLVLKCKVVLFKSLFNYNCLLIPCSAIKIDMGTLW